VTPAAGTDGAQGKGLLPGVYPPVYPPLPYMYGPYGYPYLLPPYVYPGVW
jgi:hypothetical protein